MVVGKSTDEPSKTPREGGINVLGAFNSKSKCHVAYKSCSILELGESLGIICFDDFFTSLENGIPGVGTVQTVLRAELVGTPTLRHIHSWIHLGTQVFSFHKRS